MPQTPPIILELACEDPRWSALADETALAAALSAALHRAGKPLPEKAPLLVSLILADDACLQELNRDWRGKDQPTNVLSFALDDSEDAYDPPPGQPHLLGDIYLAFETIERESRSENKEIAAHLAHLTIHGMLHLLGFDHQSEEEAEAMRDIERQAMRDIGLKNPYNE